MDVDEDEESERARAKKMIKKILWGMGVLLTKGTRNATQRNAG